jgi:hypothetical protein
MMPMKKNSSEKRVFHKNNRVFHKKNVSFIKMKAFFAEFFFMPDQQKVSDARLFVTAPE